MDRTHPVGQHGRVRIRRSLVALVVAAATLMMPVPADALDRCAATDPFTPAVRADVARRFGGHHVTASAHDTASGCTWHLNPGVRVTTASVVKVEVGAGVLLRAQRQGRGLTAAEQARLWPMITESANPPTTELWSSLGGAAGMTQLDRTFGLVNTTQASPSWGITSTTAADQVHLLRQVVLGEGGILDAAHRAPLVTAMGSVVPSQRWGVTAGTPPGTLVRQKNGFAGSACCAWRVNSVGVIEHVGGPLVLAVLSDGWGSMAQGIPAIESVARAVNESVVRSRSAGVVLIQSRFGTVGNFEVIYPAAAGGLGAMWRNNDAPGNPWSTSGVFGQSLGPVGAVTMIHSSYGNLEVVARVGDRLYSFWRGTTGWNGPTQIASGAAGNPVLIQSRLGTVGNFELAYPTVAGGLGIMWRNNDAPGTPWSAPSVFAQSLGPVSGVSMIQSSYGNLEVVARVGESLFSLWRDSGPTFTWRGPSAFL